MVKTFSKKNANKTQAQKISILSKRLSCSSMGIKLKNIIRDYSISDKLKTTFSSIILLTIIIMGISISVILFMNLRINSLYNGPYEALQVVSNIRVGLQEMDNNMYKAINASSEVSKDNAAIETTKSSREICLENANNKALELEANVKTLKEIFKEDQSTVDELASDLEETEKSRKRLSEMIELNSAPEVVKTSLDTYSMYVNFTEVKIAKIYDVAQENAQQFINSSSVYRNFAIGFFIFMLLLIVMVSYTARKVLENVLLEGINHIKDIAKDLSDGKLKINKRYDSKDEIGKMSGDLIEAVSMLISYISDITKTLGELSNGKLDIKLDESIEYKGDFIPIRKSFENIISSLNNIFYNTHQSISLVSQSSTKLADTTELLSEGSTDQAGAIEELLASFNEILNRVKNNSENAEKTNKFSDKTKEIVEKGNNKMHELMCSMEEINESSKKIAHIINSIEEISSKTNLLALNAAIEAARAGEVGKGFAVVAEEVRKLAEQSSRAVNETTQIIKNSLFVVNNGSRLAEETAKALNDIVNNVDNTADLIKEIAISSEEQKESISQMTEEIEQISKVVQVNSSTAEEISVSTDELASQSKLIYNELSKYTYSKTMHK